MNNEQCLLTMIKFKDLSRVPITSCRFHYFNNLKLTCFFLSYRSHEISTTDMVCYLHILNCVCSIYVFHFEINLSFYVWVHGLPRHEDEEALKV